MSSLKKQVYQSFLKKNHFVIKKENDKKVARCLKCNSQMKNIATSRLQKHRNSCGVKKINHLETTKTQDRPIQDFCATSSSDNHPGTNANNTSTRIDLSSIDDKLIRFFVGCNIPFAVIESTQFKEFVSSLNSEYKLPCRKTLSSTLLNKLHDNISTERSSANESNGVLIIDGWKNSIANTKNVVCIIQTTSGSSFFLNSWDFTSLSEDTGELTKVINEAVTMAKTNYNKKIYAVVSDNAPVMVAMGKAVDLWHVGCSSHRGNLLAKDIIDKTFAESINGILRAFKAPNLEREVLERGGTKMKLACETRWCSYRDAFRCCLQNLDAMKSILKNKLNNYSLNKSKKRDTEKEKFVNLYNLLSDESLIIKLQDFIVLSDPVCSLVNTCQRSECSIADAAEEWIMLNVPTDTENTQNIFKKRIDKALTPILLAANLLHPVYQGKRFIDVDESRLQALEFLKKQLGDTANHELDAYLSHDGIFGSLLKKDKIPPKLFWQMVENSYPTLSELAQKLLSIPASSAQIERLFSNWSFVHSCLRNRLTVEHSKKLTDLYYSLKFNSENN